MSHVTYNTVWAKAQELLTTTLQSEPTQADRREQRKLLATLYLRYIIIANYLSECVDQVVQPQKRMLIRKLLVATLGRILELKCDLVEADLCEWSHCGDVIESLHLNPLSCDLTIPSCFTRERKEELEYRKRTVEDTLNKLGYLEKVQTKIPLTEHKAILIIQTHERARQGRLRAQFMKEIRGMKDRGKPLQADAEEEDDSQRLSLVAALRIQKIWRGYVARRQTRRRKLHEMLLIGMIPPQKKESEHVNKALAVREDRRNLQEARECEYQSAIVEIRDNIERTQRGLILEQLGDQVRTWLREYHAHTGKIPEYTGSERPISRLMSSRQGTDSELSKSSSKESKSKKSRSPKSKDSKDEEEDETTHMKAIISVFVPELTMAKEEYDESWANKNESANTRQHHYEDIIYNEQMNSMENELRKIVDDMMRSELQLLQEAFDKDRGYKGKKQKKASKKARRGGKKAKKKKEKDLTPDRTTESLFEELIANGIIKRCPEVYLKDFIGERSYHTAVPHNKGKENDIDLGDFRQILTEYCILPLSSDQLHLSTPHIKSLMIAGPKGSGKDALVHAICTEAGALLFDLTPANIVGKYPGKSGLTMLIHLVLKVARLLPPAVIYMDNAERPFVKKIPKTDTTDPKRLKKDLPKIVKGFSSDERIMLIGVTSCPWESDQKLLQQVYQKFLSIPRAGYNSRYLVWKTLLGKFSAISWQFDISGMSRISDGFTVGSIMETVQEVITVKRMLRLRVLPLSPLELINVLCKKTPVYREEDEAFELWWSKTPLAKRRSQAVEAYLEEQAELQAKQASAKKNK
ncbi:hypothetical protein PPYR_10032 [Photinus pyralis]|uniref:ATPase AAA-type core domain-containing protein n=1 Tax=Photinus pyralis TaxID=7054 RepID=A0A5N4AF87_PHOPY|nr:dynein regulatory complex protein 11 [Photinus pyralis]KAB0795971.1 hypothetical protein PPYR_10032 [Photinus pyralis]